MAYSPAVNPNKDLPKSWQSSLAILVFFAKFIAIYLVWTMVTAYLGADIVPIEDRNWPWLSAQWEGFNDGVRLMIIKVTGFLFGLSGFDVTNTSDLLILDAWYSVKVGNYCLALQMWLIFTALILAFPGPWRHKLWFIPLGLIGINIINVIRIAAIMLLMIHAPDYVDFNHYVTFRIVTYAFILGLFLLWINKYSSRK